MLVLPAILNYLTMLPAILNNLTNLPSEYTKKSLFTVQGFGAPPAQPHDKSKAIEEEGEEEEEEGEAEGGRPSTEKPPETEDKDEEEDLGEEEEAGEEGEGPQGDEEGAAGDEEAGAPPPPSSRKKKLVNQFNFCERATLTYMNPTRVCCYYLLLPDSYCQFPSALKLKQSHHRALHMAPPFSNGSSMMLMKRTLQLSNL